MSNWSADGEREDGRSGMYLPSGQECRWTSRRPLTSERTLRCVVGWSSCRSSEFSSLASTTTTTPLLPSLPTTHSSLLKMSTAGGKTGGKTGGKAGGEGAAGRASAQTRSQKAGLQVSLSLPTMYSRVQTTPEHLSNDARATSDDDRSQCLQLANTRSLLHRESM